MPRRPNGRTPKPDEPVEANQALTVPQAGLPFDIAKFSEAEREILAKIGFTAGAAMAAALQDRADRDLERLPEHFGKSPTDLTRRFSDLPRPAQGAGVRPRKPNGQG